MHNIFGPVIYSYSRAAAISDSVLVALSERFPDQCSLYRYPVACTAAVWMLIEHGAAENGATLSGIIWDILYMSQHCVIARPDDSTVVFYVIIPSARGRMTHRLKALVHAGDRMEPVITIMLTDED